MARAKLPKQAIRRSDTRELFKRETKQAQQQGTPKRDKAGRFLPRKGR